MTDTLVISRELTNEAIRFGDTGLSNNDLRRAIELYQSSTDIPSVELEVGNETARMYLDRLKYLSMIKRLELVSEPKSVISTFLGQAVHLLSHPSTPLIDINRSVLLPAVQELHLGPGIFIDSPALAVRPFFHSIIASTPDLRSLYITLPSIDDTPRAQPRPSRPHDRIGEYLRYAQREQNGWKSLRYLDVAGQFDASSIPFIRGGICHITFKPSGRVWPAQAQSYHMATPSVVLPGLTRRLARATGIKQLIEGVIRMSSGKRNSHGMDKSVKEIKEEAGTDEGLGILGEVILQDYDIGLDEAGMEALDAEWVEEKVRGFMRSEYSRYGEDAMAEVQRRVTMTRTKAITRYHDSS